MKRHEHRTHRAPGFHFILGEIVAMHPYLFAVDDQLVIRFAIAKRVEPREIEGAVFLAVRRVEQIIETKIAPFSASSSFKSCRRGYIMQHHLSWRVASSPSLPTVWPIHSLNC